MKRLFKGFGRFLFWVALTTLALFVSLAVHLNTDSTRGVVRNTLVDFANGEISGRIEIGEIETLLPWKVVARKGAVYDENGQRVLFVERLVAVPNLAALFSGWIHFVQVDGFGVEVGLFKNEDDLPTIADAFSPKVPSPDDGTPPPIGASLGSIRVHNAKVVGNVPLIDGLALANVDAELQLRVKDEFVLRFLSGSAKWVEPYAFETSIEPLTGAIHSEPDKGIRFDTVLRTNRLGFEERADVRFRLQNEEIDLLVHADPIHASLAHQVGVPGTEILKGKVRTYFHLYGPPDDLRFYAHPSTEGGAARVRGEIRPGLVKVFGETDGTVSLPPVLENAPNVSFDGNLALEFRGEDPPTFWAHVKGGNFDDLVIPHADLEGRILEDQVQIERADLKLGGGNVSLHGSVSFEGALDLKAQGRVANLAREPNIRRLAPEVRGSAKVDAHIVSDAEGPIEVETKVVAQNLSYGDVRTGAATARGRVVLAPEGPLLDLRVHGEKVTTAGYDFGRVDADLKQNQMGRLTFDAEAQTKDGRELAARGRVNYQGDEDVEVTVDEARIRSGDQVWEGSMDALRVSKNGNLRIDKLRLGDADSHLHVDGVISPKGESDFVAELRDYSAKEFGAILGLPVTDVEGILNGRVALQGKLSDPTFTFVGTVRDGAVGQLTGVSLQGKADYHKDVLKLDLDAKVEEHGALSVEGDIYLEGSIADPIETLSSGIFDVRFETKNFELSLLQRFLPDEHPISGKLTASGTLSGPVIAPELSGDFEVVELRYRDYAPVDLEGDLDYQQGYMISRVTITDEHGPLLEVEGNLLLDLAYAIGHPREALEAISTTPWRLSLRSEHRTLEQWPAWLSDYVPTTVRDVSMGFVAGFSGGTSSTNGYADVILEWADEEVSIFGCGGGEQSPHLQVRANLVDGKTRVDVLGFVAGRPALRGLFSVATPIDDWLAGEVIAMNQPANLVLEVPRLPVASVPELCLFATGEIGGKAELSGLFTTSPRGTIEIDGENIAFFNASPGDLAMRIEVDPSEITAKAEMNAEDGGRIELDGYFPLRFENPFMPVLDPDRAAFNLDVRNASLAPLLAWVPQVESAGGHVDGVVQVRSKDGNLDMSGELVLDDGFMKIGSLGQHLSRMNGRLILHSDWIELDQITGYDDGSASLNGALYFDGWTPSRIKLNVETDSFPVRSEGIVLARATTEFGLQGQFGIDAAELDVKVKDANVQLPEATTRTTQPLQEHPDIHVLGRRYVEPEALNEYPLRVTVDATEPFWVRRTDFAAQIAAEIEAIYKQEELYLSGYIEIRRGFFEVFGKRFELEWGTMNFDGTSSMDPGVNLEATHELSGGGTVTVVVSGTLRRPEVTFSSTESANQGEIIGLLLGGGRSRANATNSAEGDAANFLGGIAAGMLTLTLRDEFGDYIPMFAFDYDRGFGVRAGWDADSLIPEAFSSFVTGAYFEGHFKSTDGNSQNTSTSSSAQSGGLGVKFMLELQHPNSFITQIMYMVPNNARIDFIWEP